MTAVPYVYPSERIKARRANPMRQDIEIKSGRGTAFHEKEVPIQFVEPTPEPPRKPIALLDNPSAPSILEQTEWPCGFYAFPDEGEAFQRSTEYFNPTITRRRGVLHLITRRRHVINNRRGENTLWTWKLNDDGLNPREGRPIHITPTYNGEHWEDPRAFPLPNGSTHLSWCNFNLRSMPHQCYGELLATSNFIRRPLRLVYGNNASRLRANTGPEKNWTWFLHKGALMCSYIPSPKHVVLRVEQNAVVEEFSSDSGGAQTAWKYGLIRGGTPPVCIGHHYLAFMHSRLPWRFSRGKMFNRYYMGAILFEARPPFAITHITPKPLLEGSDHDRRNLGAPIVAWAAGAMQMGDSWFVPLGINDVACAWIRIPNEDLMKLLVSI